MKADLANRSHLAITILAALLLLGFGMVCGWSLKPLVHSNSAPMSESLGRGLPDDSTVSDSRDHASAHLLQDTDFFSEVHEVLSIRQPGKRERAIRVLAEGLDVTQIQEALRGMEKSRVSQRDEVIVQLYARWGEIDPGAAMESAVQIAKPAVQTEAVKAVLGAWVESDAASAEQFVSGLPGGLLKNSASETLIIALAVADPAHALSLAEARDFSWSEAATIAGGIFDGWIGRNPQEAAARALQLAPGELRTAALSRVANEWTRVDLKAALAWAEALPDQDFEVKTPGSVGVSPIYGVLETWINMDSSAAVNWLAQLPDGQKRAAMVSSARTLLNSAGPTPATAMQLAMLLPQGSVRDQALQQFAQSLARWEPASAVAWMQQQTDPQNRRAILSGLLSHLSGDDLRRALEATQSLEPEARKEIVSIQSSDRGGTSGWNLADPATLAAWAERQPDNQELLNRIAQSWTGRDPEGATKWLQKLPAPKRDVAIHTIIRHSLSGVPIDTAFDTTRHFQSAERWVLQLSSKQAQESAYQELAQRWIQMDPEFARGWVSTSPLPQAAKDRLLQMP